MAAQAGHTDGTVAEVCQCVPGALLAGAHPAQARDVLVALVEDAAGGLLPVKPGLKRRQFDAFGNLWFVRAAHLYRVVTGDDATWREIFVPKGKRIVQAFVAGEFAGFRMNDGGLLEMTAAAAKSLSPGAPITLNILWDNALAVLAEGLRHAGDASTGDHFDRLSGRFRRSFLKGYWCEAHGCLCLPSQRETEGHAAMPVAPEPEQLLAAAMPCSVVPRTKQRVLVDMFLANWRTEMGIRVPRLEHGLHGAHVVSPLALAWLVEGHVRTSDTPATAVAEGLAYLAACWQAMEAHGKLARYYTGAVPAKIKGNAVAHGPTMAEVTRVHAALASAAGRAIGNSKRARIDDVLFPVRT